jgi:hypothetical protein
MRLLLVLLALVATTGCRHTFPTPYSRAQLRLDSDKWPGDALVHYLSQGSADVEVCGPTTELQRLDEKLVEPFIDALEDRLPPGTWQACAVRIVPALDEETQELTWERLARIVKALFTQNQTARLLAAHEVIATRPRVPSLALERLSGELENLDRQRLEPALVPLVDTFISTLELEQGRLRGKVLTAADIENEQDDGLLARMTSRLPDEALRQNAKRRLIRLRIERSPTREVKERADEVERAVLATGRWAQPAKSLQLERPEAPLPLPFSVVAAQDVETQVVGLSARASNGDEVASRLELASVLRFPVGWSRPLVLCEPAERLSVEPCLDPLEVEVANPMVRFDAQGVLRLPESITMERAFELAHEDVGIVLPVRLSGRLVTSLQIPLSFLAPEPIRFVADQAEIGPAVNVVVQLAPSALLFSTVSQTGARKLAVLPRGTTTAFEVASIGGVGLTGRDGRQGRDGRRGYDGMNAACPSTPAQDGGRGSDGQRGGDGWPGGPGGDGGLVRVQLQCGGRCPAEEAFVRSIVFSRGGAGGPGGDGGRGGKGGDGGRGGSSASCSGSFLSSGSSGFSGHDGPRGADGERGPDGRPGLVELVVE